MRCSFRKTWISFILAISVLFALAVPASAADVTYTGQTNTISAGNNHTAVIDENGDLWVWGSNWQGQIGNGGEGDVTISEPFGDGNPEHIITYKLQTTPVKVLSDVVSVSCGNTFTAAIRSDGSLWMWGYNQWGQLGNGRVGDAKFRQMDGSLDIVQTTPVKIMDDVVSVSCGSSHTCAVKNDGSLWAWGHNIYGPVGNGGAGNDAVEGWAGNIITIQSVPVKIMDDVIAADCAEYYTAALKKDGTLWLWGTYHQDVFSSTMQPNPVNIRSNVAAFWCNPNSYLTYVDNNGTMSTLEDEAKSPVMSDVKTVKRFSMVGGGAILQNNGALWMWGSNYYGAQGTGQPASGMDAIYNYTPIKLMDNVSAVCCGDTNVAVIKSDGSVWCWGNNANGEVGNGKTGELIDGSISQLTPYQVSGITAKLPESTTIVVPDKPSAWAEQQVADAINDGLVPEHMQSGYTEPISRADVAQMFINLIEKSSGKTIETVIKENGATVSNAFTDTNDPAVLYANALGIINGVGDNRFDPDGLLTRAQCAVIINRVANVLGVQTEGYTHNFVDLEGHWAADSLGWPVYAGVINGVGDNRFAPDEPLTCEQAIVISYRALEYLR